MQIGVKCAVKNNDNKVLRFWFDRIPTGLNESKTLKLKISNFHNPWSAVTLNNNELQWYADENCTKLGRRITLAASSFKAG